VTGAPAPLPVPVDVGAGDPVAILHGYGMLPATYRRTAELLAGGGAGRPCRVVVPNLFAVGGAWSFERVVHAFTLTLDELRVDRVTLVGHSFGGGIELGFAAAHPDRVVELVFSDTLAVSEEWGLADEALRHPVGLLRLATGPAALAFATQWVVHPRAMLSAAWWGFRSKRDGSIGAVAEAGIPAHVLWANRDSILPRADGERFAELLGATFTVATSPTRRYIDHDWMFGDPPLFVRHLRRLHLRIMSEPPGAAASR
jgi:pimeloyl-ACP methyl ester carboxylesterase